MPQPPVRRANESFPRFFFHFASSPCAPNGCFSTPEYWHFHFPLFPFLAAKTVPFPLQSLSSPRSRESEGPYLITFLSPPHSFHSSHSFPSQAARRGRLSRSDRLHIPAERGGEEAEGRTGLHLSRRSKTAILLLSVPPLPERGTLISVSAPLSRPRRRGEESFGTWRYFLPPKMYAFFAKSDEERLQCAFIAPTFLRVMTRDVFLGGKLNKAPLSNNQRGDAGSNFHQKHFRRRSLLPRQLSGRWVIGIQRLKPNRDGEMQEEWERKRGRKPKNDNPSFE